MTTPSHMKFIPLHSIVIVHLCYRASSVTVPGRKCCLRVDTQGKECIRCICSMCSFFPSLVYYLFVYLKPNPCLPAYLSTCLSVCLSACLPTCLSVCLSGDQTVLMNWFNSDVNCDWCCGVWVTCWGQTSCLVLTFILPVCLSCRGRPSLLLFSSSLSQRFFFGFGFFGLAACRK